MAKENLITDSEPKSTQRIRNFLIILLVAQVLNLVAFKSVEISQRKLANWMYQNYSAPFLK